MNNYMKTNVLCCGLLGALALTACSDSTTAQNFGTTEDRNAFWDESANLKDWNVMKGSDIKLENSKSALLGRVSLEKAGANGLARAGIAYDVSKSDGTPTDLSQGNDGLCIAYHSDFDVEVRLDTADYASSSVDKDVPYVSLNMKDIGDESHCASWKDFKTKDSDKSGSEIAKKVRSVQLVFVGASGSTGEFSIQRLTPYVRSDLWIGKDGSSIVETGFAKGDEGTSGALSFFEDSSEAYFDWGYTYDYTDLAEKIEFSEGIYGNVVFEGSSSNPDVGFEFLVAGKTTKDGKDFIYTADVSNLWKGMCMEYGSGADLIMELVPGDSSTGTLENGVKTMTFAKNIDMEKNCVVFASVLDDSDDILKHLAKIRVKFTKGNWDKTAIAIRRISALVPENLSVKESGESKDVTPTQSSDHKSGKSFLWDGSVDGNHVDLGISGATASGVWTNSPEDMDTYSFGFPDDVEADDNGDVITSLVNKHHKFTGYVKSDDGIYALDSVPSIGFNTVSSNLEPADISAWGGFCIHYSTYNFIRIALITDASANKYWYAEVDYSDDMAWGKVSWDAFKNVDEESNEKIEDIIGKITTVQLQFPVDGEFVVDRFGSYDQCGK